VNLKLKLIFIKTDNQIKDMWKPIYQPEPWPQFVKRKDIAPLPLMEQRRKHMEEQMLFENYVSSVNTMSTLNAGAAGGPAPGSGGPSYKALNNANFTTVVASWFTDQVVTEEEYGPIAQWNTTAVTNMEQAFENKTTFNQDISGWDVSNVITLERMFLGATSFNQNLNGWNVSNVTNMNNMFSGATSFNSPVNDWDVSNVTQVVNMFSGASAFQQPLNLWEINSVGTNLGSFFMGTTGTGNAITYTGYDALLIGWAANEGNLKDNVTFGFGDSTYSAGAATTARGILTTGKGWTITDGGPA
jgi:surface protein